MDPRSFVYETALKEVAFAAGLVADFCDKTEHNESVDGQWVIAASEKLLTAALAIAEFEEIDLQEAYASRLSQIERRNVIWGASAFQGEIAAREAQTMRDLQVVQLEHDRVYHPDVLGLKKEDQLRHYALHLSKLVAALAGVILDDSTRPDFLLRRLPDMLLFSIKLQTVMSRRLALEIKLSDYQVQTSLIS